MKKEQLIKKKFMSAIYDIGAIAEYLEDMAAQGFMFVKQKGIWFYFQSCEPKKVKFSIDLFRKATLMDTRPEKDTLEYIEYCKEAGWQHIYTNGKLQYFYSEQENPTPIETDKSALLKNINQQFWLSRGLVVFMALFEALMVLGMFGVFAFLIKEEGQSIFRFLLEGGFPAFLYGMFFFEILLAVLGIMEIKHYTHFYFTNKKRIQKEESLFFYSKKQLHSYNHKYLGIFFLMIATIYVTTAYFSWKMAMIFGIFSVAIFAIIMATEFYRQGNKKMNRSKSFWFSVAVGIFVAVLWICLPMVVQGIVR